MKNVSNGNGPGHAISTSFDVPLPLCPTTGGNKSQTQLYVPMLYRLPMAYWLEHMNKIQVRDQLLSQTIFRDNFSTLLTKFVTSMDQSMSCSQQINMHENAVN